MRGLFGYSSIQRLFGRQWLLSGCGREWVLSGCVREWVLILRCRCKGAVLLREVPEWVFPEGVLDLLDNLLVEIACVFAVVFENAQEKLVVVEFESLD